MTQKRSTQRQSRREFIKSTATAGAGIALFNISGTRASGRIIGSNERIQVGVVGIKGRGGSHIGGFNDGKNSEVVALIDIDSTQFAPRKKNVKDKTGKEPAVYQDVRDALADDNIDAISIATCNHTHSLYTIWACQAGKDVYVEKPMSHNVWEGRKCVEAARKYGSMVQHGTQQRSSQGRANEIAAVQSGNYGKLLVSKGYCCKPRWSIGFKPIQDPPAHINFDIWLGPAPLQPFHGNLVHYNWHWFWDFGNGDTGNQGVHEMDVARWAIKGATLPDRVWALGGRLAYKDQGQTPNTQMAVYEYGDTLLLFETRGLVGKHGVDRMVKNEYYTTDGMITGGKFHPKNGGKAESIKGGEPEKVTDGGTFGSFLKAMRSRKVEDLNADVEEAHYSSALCHLANISNRLGNETAFSKGPPKKHLGDDPRVNGSFEKIESNLKAVGVNLNETSYQLGPVLDLDVAKERFVGNDEANQMLSRDYRKPWVVPEKV